jgi:DNA modification methylase
MHAEAGPTRRGDVWQLGAHRLMCGDAGSRRDVQRLAAGERVTALITSPPYDQQRRYAGAGAVAWDGLMQRVFRAADAALAPGAQLLVNLGLVHRAGEWQPYWRGWERWMRRRGWRRFGLYVWDQGPGLPGDWNGRLAPAFELVFHWNQAARRPNKIVPCKWAGTANKGSGLRGADGVVRAYTHAGRAVQAMRIPDSVLRITRHKARGIETGHPAVFPIALPAFLMEAFTAPSEAIYEPFAGAGTTLLAGQRTGRRVLAMELAPAYVDLAVERWRRAYPELQARRITCGNEGGCQPD